MKDIKKLMITLVALLALTTGAWAQGPWTSGDCTVTLSGDVMTVSGTGAMANYADSYALPWYGADIKTIVIESGVTGIGNSAFAKCYNLESVSIPASVTSIGMQAFENCGYDATALTVSFAEGSTPLTIGESAFYYANLKSIDIPNRVTSIGNGAFTSCSNLESVSIPASVTSIGNFAFQSCGSYAEALTVSFAEGSTLESIGEGTFLEAKLTSINIPNSVTSIGTFAFSGCSNLESVSIPASVTSIGYNAFSSCSKLESVSIPASVTSISEGAFRYCGKLANVYIFAPSLTTYGANAFASNADGRKIYVLSDAVDTYKAGWPDYAADFVGDLQPLASGPEVAWDKAEKTGTFTMPGGNVTLEPEYYPQAALTAAPTAINDVPATTDGAIVKAGTVANIGSTETAQGTVMYYVSQTALDDAALLALDADQWTADVPTAESLAQGQAYVYYYVRGNDSDTDEENFSDGDILAANALTVTIAAEPTYAVEFAEGTEESDKWTVKAGTDGSFQSLPLKGVKAGTKVKLKYDGDRSMLKGVTAVKKAAAPAYTLLSAAATSDVGKVVCAAGHLHDAKTAVPDGCTAVGILGKVTTTGHGLILALHYSYFQDWYTINGWTSASYAGTTLKVLPDDARDTNLTSYTALGETAVSNWAVAQKSDYVAIFTNLGSTTGNSDGKTYDGNVNAYITTGVGGTALSGDYWSATDDDDDPWFFSGNSWSHYDKGQSIFVWPVLGF